MKTKIGLIMVAMAIGIALSAAKAEEESAITPGDLPKVDNIVGTVGSVNTQAMTLTVGNRILTVSLDTELRFKGQRILLSEIAVGDTVHGTVVRSFSGREEAGTIILHPLGPDYGKKK